VFTTVLFTSVCSPLYVAARPKDGRGADGDLDLLLDADAATDPLADPPGDEGRGAGGGLEGGGGGAGGGRESMSDSGALEGGAPQPSLFNKPWAYQGKSQSEGVPHSMQLL
jgi:hypothetical protein